MTFKEAQRFVMPFGKHKGKTLEQVAQEDNGLRYLDWLAGEKLKGRVNEAVDAYMKDPGIQKDLDTLLEDNPYGESSSGDEEW